MNRYYLEFILNIKDTSPELIKNSLIEFGENLVILPFEEDYKISIDTEDPTIIFDTCSQFGRLKSVKINEGRQ